MSHTTAMSGVTDFSFNSMSPVLQCHASYPVASLSVVSILFCPFAILCLTIRISPHYFYNHVFTVCTGIKRTTPGC